MLDPQTLVVKGGDFLAFFEISDSSGVQEIARIDNLSGALVAANEDLVVLKDDAQLVLVDVSALDAPRVVGRIETTEPVAVAALSDSLLMVSRNDIPLPTFLPVACDPACYEGAGLTVFDVSDPVLPLEVGQLTFRSLVRGIAVQEELVLVADRLSGLRIVDISDPSAPISISTVRSGSVGYGVASYENIALAVFSGVLLVFDLSDPRNPNLIDTLDIQTQSFQGIEVLGNLVFISSFSTGVTVLRLGSDSFTPNLATTYRADG